MRLIDADILINKVEKSLIDNPHTEGKVSANHNYEHQHFMRIITKQPTVYDVDKVVESLEECKCSEEDANREEDIYMRNAHIQMCINVVKGAIKDE